MKQTFSYEWLLYFLGDVEWDVDFIHSFIVSINKYLISVSVNSMVDLSLGAEV